MNKCPLPSSYLIQFIHPYSFNDGYNNVRDRTNVFSFLVNLLNYESKKDYMENYAITMWDFSWIERQWPGAGYENWNKVLDELTERGYNAIRIDAFPHLISYDASKYWTLKPVWNQQQWGSPAKNVVQVQPGLNDFIRKCAERNIKVALSTWYREDVDNIRMEINHPEIMANQWIKTLQSIEKEHLLEHVLYVDLCNEWPHPLWAPFFENIPGDLGEEGWYTDKSMQWMKEAVEIVRYKFPDLFLTFSFKANRFLSEKDMSFLDLLEPHVWMAKCNDEEFNKKTGYSFPFFTSEGFESLVDHAEKLYHDYKDHWKKLLVDEIITIANIAKEKNMPLVTTECWALVDYKDWPLLKWDWIKELCALGVSTAVKTGAWKAIATSNFCGPQFIGMWRDIEWHKSLTKLIRK